MRLKCVDCGKEGARPFEDSAPYSSGSPRGVCEEHGLLMASRTLAISRNPTKDFRTPDAPADFGGRFVGIEFEMFHKTHDTDRAEALAMDWRLANCGVGEDGSIRSPAGIEVKTPPMAGEDIPAWVQAVCGRAAAYGMTTDKSCGLHVHLDVRDYDHHSFRRLFRLMRALEPIIYAALPPERMTGGMSYPLQVAHSRIESIRGQDSLNAAWRTQPNGSGRYHGFNYTALGEHGTVEMRYHSGTLNPQKVLPWVKLLMQAVETAKRATYRDIPHTFTDFEDRFNTLTRFLHLEPLQAHFAARIRFFQHNLVELERLLGAVDNVPPPLQAGAHIDGFYLHGEFLSDFRYCALHHCLEVSLCLAFNLTPVNNYIEGYAASGFGTIDNEGVGYFICPGHRRVEFLSGACARDHCWDISSRERLVQQITIRQHELGLFVPEPEDDDNSEEEEREAQG